MTAAIDGLLAFGPLVTILSERNLSNLEPLHRFRARLVLLHKSYDAEDETDALILEMPDSTPDDAPARLARRKIGAIYSHFPTKAPAREQAAFLVRAIVGLRLFPDANVRTALDFIGELLSHQGMSLDLAGPDEDELSTSIWGEYASMEADAITIKELETKDEFFDYLARWFKGRIH